jgi:hypothetical protein
MSYMPKNTRDGKITTRRGKVVYDGPPKKIHYFLFKDMYRVFNAVFDQPLYVGGDDITKWRFIWRVSTLKLRDMGYFKPKSTVNWTQGDQNLYNTAVFYYKTLWDSMAYILNKCGLPEPIIDLVKAAIIELNRILGNQINLEY